MKASAHLRDRRTSSDHAVTARKFGQVTAPDALHAGERIPGNQSAGDELPIEGFEGDAEIVGGDGEADVPAPVDRAVIGRGRSGHRGQYTSAPPENPKVIPLGGRLKDGRLRRTNRYLSNRKGMAR